MVIYFDWYHGYQYRRIWYWINRRESEAHVIDVPIRYEPPPETIKEQRDNAYSIVETAVLKALGFKPDVERKVEMIPKYDGEEMSLDNHQYKVTIL